MQVEHDLAWVRLLIGLHGMRARKEVNEIVSGIVEMGAALQYTEDKLTNIMEAAQVRDSSSICCAPIGAVKKACRAFDCDSWTSAGHGHGGVSAETGPSPMAGGRILSQLRAPEPDHPAGMPNPGGTTLYRMGMADMHPRYLEEGM